MIPQIITDPKEILEKEVNPLVNYAMVLDIKSHDDFVAANEKLQEIKRRESKIEEVFDPIRVAQHQAWKLTCDTISQLMKPLKNADEIIRKKCVAWNNEQERKQQEAARIAEAKRQEEERKEREKLEARAKKAEESGKFEKAEVLREDAKNVVVQPNFIPPAAPKVNGSSFRKVWKGEVTDIKLLCQSILDGRIGIEVFSPDQTVINNLAKGFKGSVQVPGLRFYEETVMAMRAS